MFKKEFIYCIECVSNGRKYIGRSKNVDSRVSSHFNRLKRGEHHVPLMQEDFNKYGEKAFIARILGIYSNYRSEHERGWQLLLKTYSRVNGYNYNDKFFTGLEGQALIKERETGNLSMIVSMADREIKEIIEKHHTYGAEVVIKSLVQTVIQETYLCEEDVLQMVHNAFEREKLENQQLEPK